MSHSPAFTSPAAAPHSSARREKVLKEARKRGWLVAPRARHFAEAALAAVNAGTLPEIKQLKSPVADKHTDVDDLCDNLNRVLEWDDHQVTEHATCVSSDVVGGVRMKGASQWLGAGDFASVREASAQRLLLYFDKHVLKGTLLGTKVQGSERVTISWSSRLYKTAGQTYMKRRAVTGDRTAAIQLSIKVVDEPSRLYNTLAHEICHALTWIMDDCAKPPHGAVFKRWAQQFAHWDRTLRITTCHDYDIRYKFNYECVGCGQTYGRHSRSIDINKKVCGGCRGRLRLQKSS